MQMWPWIGAICGDCRKKRKSEVVCLTCATAKQKKGCVLDLCYCNASGEEPLPDHVEHGHSFDLLDILAAINVGIAVHVRGMRVKGW